MFNQLILRIEGLVLISKIKLLIKPKDPLISKSLAFNGFLHNEAKEDKVNYLPWTRKWPTNKFSKFWVSRLPMVTISHSKNY